MDQLDTMSWKFKFDGNSEFLCAMDAFQHVANTLASLMTLKRQKIEILEHNILLTMMHYNQLQCFQTTIYGGKTCEIIDSRPLNNKFYEGIICLIKKMVEALETVYKCTEVALLESKREFGTAFSRAVITTALSKLDVLLRNLSNESFVHVFIDQLQDILTALDNKLREELWCISNQEKKLRAFMNLSDEFRILAQKRFEVKDRIDMINEDLKNLL